MVWQIVVALAGGLIVVWASLVVVMYVAGRTEQDPTKLRDVLRLVPDVIRLLRRLAADPTLPRGVRIRLFLLVGYLISPIDLIPDFIPVVGYADDAVIVVWALRSVTRTAGPEAVDRHWTGTPEGLRALKRLAGLSEP
jgi:uncharacterized membrane protein YkvA (DUF1232 family)